METCNLLIGPVSLILWVRLLWWDLMSLVWGTKKYPMFPSVQVGQTLWNKGPYSGDVCVYSNSIDFSLAIADANRSEAEFVLKLLHGSSMRSSEHKIEKWLRKTVKTIFKGTKQTQTKERKKKLRCLYQMWPLWSGTRSACRCSHLHCSSLMCTAFYTGISWGQAVPLSVSSVCQYFS